MWSLCRLGMHDHTERTPEEAYHRVMTAHGLLSRQPDMCCMSDERTDTLARPRLYWKHGVVALSNNAWRSTIFVTSHNAVPYGRVPYLFSSGCIWIAFAIQSCNDPDWIRATIEVTTQAAHEGSRNKNTAGRTCFLDIPAYYACRHRATDTTWYMGVYACSFTDHEDKCIQACLPDGTRAQVLSIRTARFHDFSVDSRAAVLGSQPSLYCVARPWEQYLVASEQEAQGRGQGGRTKDVYVFPRHSGPVTDAAKGMVTRTFCDANYVSLSVQMCRRLIADKASRQDSTDTWRGLFFNRRPRPSECRVTAYVRNRDIRTKAVVHMDQLTVQLWAAWLRIGVLTPSVCAERNMHIPLSSGWWPSDTWHVTVE